MYNFPVEVISTGFFVAKSSQKARNQGKVRQIWLKQASKGSQKARKQGKVRRIRLNQGKKGSQKAKNHGKVRQIRFKQVLKVTYIKLSIKKI